MNNIEKLQAKLESDDYAAIVYSPHNRFYFTSFPSTDGILFVCKKAAVFLIDSRYVEAAKKESRNCEVVLLTGTAKQLRELVSQYGIKTVGIESNDLSVSQAERFKNMLPDAKMDMSDTLSDIILKLRMIKTPEEIKSLQKAQDITDAAFKHILTVLKPGISERDIALEIEYFMKKNGALGPSFELITVSGENTSRPHGVPGDRKLQMGDFVTLDIGDIVDGYCSDMTRTVAIGKITDEQKKVYDTVLKAQTESEAALFPGKRCNDIDKIARDIIDNAGYRGCFGHGLGHSVGIQIHEDPRLSPNFTTVLEPGMVLTVEPGIYLEGKFGVRIEDMTLITENGYMVFTKSPKELISL